MVFKGNNSALSTIHFDTEYSHENVYLPYIISLMCPTPSAVLDRFINKPIRSTKQPFSQFYYPIVLKAKIYDGRFK